VDEPLADSSLIPTYLVSRLIRTEATVALGGDGGDELFAGYRHYSAMQRQDRLRTVIPGRLLSWPGAVAARLLPPGFRGRNFLIGLAPSVEEAIAKRNLVFDHRSRLALLSPALRRQALHRPNPEDRLRSLCAPHRTTLQQATAVDFRTYLVDDLLVKIDRASMVTSLEMRAPWLDHRVIEFAFGRVPDALRATSTERKILPKRLAQRLLPPALDLSRKRGFSVPLRSWFRQGWADHVEEVLRSADPGLFDGPAVEALVSGQERGANVERLLGLTLFELWRREYNIGLPA
jgi:asparagine synthase (glutamine-hydrolysing)